MGYRDGWVNSFFRFSETVLTVTASSIHDSDSTGDPITPSVTVIVSHRDPNREAPATPSTGKGAPSTLTVTGVGFSLVMHAPDSIYPPTQTLQLSSRDGDDRAHPTERARGHPVSGISYPMAAFSTLPVFPLGT